MADQNSALPRARHQAVTHQMIRARRQLELHVEEHRCYPATAGLEGGCAEHRRLLGLALAGDREIERDLAGGEDVQEASAGAMGHWPPQAVRGGGA